MSSSSAFFQTSSDVILKRLALTGCLISDKYISVILKQAVEKKIDLKTIYYSFHTGIYTSSLIKNGFLSGKIALPIDTSLRSYISKLLKDITKNTGIRFIYQDAIDASMRNVMFITNLPDAGMPMTSKGLLDHGKGYVLTRTIRLDSTRHPSMISWIAAHEIGHALGLAHPEGGDLYEGIMSGAMSPTVSCHDTAMSPCWEVEGCANQNDSNEECYSVLPLKNPFSREDYEAMKECLTIATASSEYISPYQATVSRTFPHRCIDHGTSLPAGPEAKPKQTELNLTGFLAVSVKSFLSAFIKTLLKYYIKPYLIEKKGYSSRGAEIASKMGEKAIDISLYSLVPVLLSESAMFIFKKIFKKMGINDSRLVIALETSIAVVLDDKSLMKTLLSLPGTALGEKLAWDIIRKGKFHQDPSESKEIKLERPFLSVPRKHHNTGFRSSVLVTQEDHNPGFRVSRKG